MARKRNPNRDKAKQIWLDSKGSTPLVDIAFELDVTPSTIRKWKSTDKWDLELKGSAPIDKGSAPIQARGSPGAPKGNKNAVGNIGGGAPVGNSNAVTHGFFRKHLPPAAMEMVEDMDAGGIGPLDMLWMSIQTQFAAIMHAQKVMFVESKDEMIKELKKEKFEIVPTRDGPEQVQTEEEWNFQFAWERQAQFLNALSRAKAELRSLSKDYIALSGQDDMRRQQLEKMQHEIKMAEAHLAIANRKYPEQGEEVYEDDGFIDALGDTAAEVWADDET